MNKKGFTLIEIIAVIVILVVLAVIIVPKVYNFKPNAGETVEKMLIKGLETYNTDKKSEIWSADSKPGDCYVMSYQELLYYNPDIKLGDCLINGYKDLIIKKVEKGYEYYANITCSIDFTDPDKYLLEDQNTDNAYYRSSNAYSCNNLD